MSFQITNAQGVAIPLNELDNEAQMFWHNNTDIDSKFYTGPHERGTNWFDTIGWNIHHPKVNYTKGWNNIKCSMFAVQSSEWGMLALPEIQSRLPITMEWLRPYFELIDHWEAKGYKPVQVNE